MMQDELRIGDWTVHPQLNQLAGPDREVHLEPRTMAVLMELARAPGQVRTRDDLLGAVWGDAFVGEAVLTHSIWELRRAFGDQARDPAYIQTIPRRGYRLVADVDSRAGRVLRALSITDDGSAEHLRLFDRPVDALRQALEALDSAESLESEPLSSIVVHLVEVPPDLELDSESATPTWEYPAGIGLARAVSSLSGPGQILLTRGAFDLARWASEGLDEIAGGLTWLSHGAYALSGDFVEALAGPNEISTTIELFEVGRQGVSPLRAPRETGVARRNVVDGIIEGWRAAQGLPIPQRRHWHLRRKLGEGGFGEVWLGAHEATGEKRVFKFCYEAERLRALQREVTLFRLLKETLGERRDIVRILDWNFDEPPYFLEIEHSESGSLPEWAEGQGGLDQVSLPIRLELVAQVADALAAAHSVGVLHKDVKPSNVLVESRSDAGVRARLTDFGIGQVTDRKVFDRAGITALGITGTQTRAGSSSGSGTRLYQAPELLEGRPFTNRADIYALGVVLYQVVAGEFDRAAAMGWERRVDDPLLVELIAACVDGSPDHRLASASEISKALRSLEARRRERAERQRQLEKAEAYQSFLRASQRRRKILMAASLVTVFVLALVSAFAVQTHRARQVAEQRRQQAEGLIGFMLGDLRSKLEPVGRLDIMADLGDRAMAYFDQLPEEYWSDDERLRRVLALRQIGEVQRLVGDLEAAEAAFRDSLELSRTLVELDPDDSARQIEYCAALFWVGQVRFDHGDYAGAREHMQRYLDIARSWTERRPDDDTWRLEFAQATSNVGSISEQMGDLPAALEAYRRRLEILQSLVATDPGNPTWRLDLSLAHNTVGVALAKLGQLAEAQDHFRSDLDLKRALARDDPQNSQLRLRLATSHYYLGENSKQLGRSGEARRHFETHLAIARELAEQDPENGDWQRELGVAQRSLGHLLEGSGDPKQDLELLRESVATLSRLTSRVPEHPEWALQLVRSHLSLGEALRASGNEVAAAVEAQKALDLIARAEPSSPELADRARAILVRNPG